MGIRRHEYGEPYSVASRLILPENISVEQTDTGQMVRWQSRMSKAVWRPAPGRKLAFFIKEQNDVVGLVFLASPVIQMTARDEYLGLGREGKGKALRNYADLSVCVGAQPISWYWNIGKLCALLAPTLGDYFYDRYGDELKGVITTSLYGRSTQYNKVYKMLGYTKGYGHENISDDEYAAMLTWMRENGVKIPGTRFGDGSNGRWRRISAYRKASGIKGTFMHGNKRGIYYHPAVPTDQRGSVIQKWYERWGLPRYERVKGEAAPYESGLV